MKRLKRIASLILACIMVLAMAIPTFAAGNNKIVINNDVTGYTYKAYQILAGTYSGDTLVDLSFGEAIEELDSTTKTAALASMGLATDATADDVAAWLTAEGRADADITAFATGVGNLFTDATTGYESTYADGKYTISNLEDGYYLVKTTGLPDENSAHTSYLLHVVGGITETVDVKQDIPEVDKEVDEVDIDLSEDVKFTITATLPENYGSYDVYKMVFHDTMSEGLTAKDDLKMTVVNPEGSVDVDLNNSGLSMTEPTLREGGNYTTVTIADTNKLIAADGSAITVTKDSKIVLTYSATLNEKAVIGGTGNPNTVYLEYSNNPNHSGGGETGKTPEDKVVVWTFELDVTKVDGKNAEKTLDGAEFVLLNEAGTHVATLTNGRITGWTAVAGITAQDGTIDWPEASVVTSDSKGEFKVIGLDTDTYKLREIKAPTGYNLLTKDLTLVITAEYSDDGSTAGGIVTVDKITLTTLSAKLDNNNLTTDKDKGIVSAQIANNSGVELPSTGGVGTTIFYIIGCNLVICAGVLLITRKRMSRNA